MPGQSVRDGKLSVGGGDASGDYVREAPSAQLAIDLFKGEWSCALPAPYADCNAGTVPAFDDDPRVCWAAEALGGFKDARILELGPLEGAHTYQMQQRGAASVRAIESNRRAFLRCLIVKELLGLDRVRFDFGDFVAYLRQTTERFDLIFASGVLYHMENPLELLNLAATHTDRLFLWTHYYDEKILSARADLSHNFRGRRMQSHAGYRCEGHVRAYGEALGWSGFCGGPEAHSVWLERDDILGALKAYGFTKVVTGVDTPEHHSGPAFCVVAERA